MTCEMISKFSGPGLLLPLVMYQQGNDTPAAEDGHGLQSQSDLVAVGHAFWSQFQCANLVATLGTFVGSCVGSVDGGVGGASHL